MTVLGVRRPSAIRPPSRRPSWLHASHTIAQHLEWHSFTSLTDHRHILATYFLVQHVQAARRRQASQLGQVWQLQF